uniref:aryl hydrocarbon receptor-like n=1 Tax=Doryrhamphus excisus TaxID=161450 RepID=UPI0025AEA5A9|nr:aryl hydrocarbon receptor-like [Doryrhamphus excisus]XP_057908308.1 aryl hydrocarbon receptor-like [Doryrhamphus excisus]XP_057908309.1 aryl hydrocarbon receptor-like [Doryrhamphus excisus]
MYAGRKRRKPVQKGAKLIPAEGAKSNPSKRHRDRLNMELDRLARLLPFPEDVISSLDKLSILRLSVSYLRTKGFFSVALKRCPSNVDHHGDKVSEHTASCMSEGELLLQALSGFVLVITSEGIIFYCSQTIQDYLGFHQTDVMHQSVFELIHTEDQQEFRRNLHWSLNLPSTESSLEAVAADAEPTSYNPDELPPENSSFLERSFVCRFRCLLDNSTGFLALSIQGRLKFLRGQSHLQHGNERTRFQLALFAIATPLKPPAILEIRTKNMIFRTKHKLDFTPMACDAKGKIVLGYTEAELRVRGSGYQFIHAADMLYCAENHVRMIKTGESGLTVFRLLTKDNRWKWVQANARLVYKNGKPDYIIATQRPLVEEEGGEHLRKRSMHLPFTFATGEALLYQTGYPLYGFPEPVHDNAKANKSKKGKMDKKGSEHQHPKSLLEVMMSQDESVYCQPESEAPNSYHWSTFNDQQGETPQCGDSWQMLANREAVKSNGRVSTCEPLLATLDSLSLDGEETCSNIELFSALENLGLNAEDLELLLLDERMIQVEVDPSHVSTANSEILSYIHDSMEMENGDYSNIGRFGPTTLPPNPSQSATQEVQAHFVPATPSTPSPCGQSVTPQQMQQLPSVGGLQFPSGNVDTSLLSGIPDSHWIHLPEEPCPDNNIDLLAGTLLLNRERKDMTSPLESDQQLQLEPHQAQQQPYPQEYVQTQERTFSPNKHTFLLPDVLVDAADCNVSNVSLASRSALTGANLRHYQSIVEPYTRQGQDLHKQQGCALAPGLSQGPLQRSALELEKLVALTQPSVEAYSLFSATTQDTCSQMENGCLLKVANATYIRTCLMSNGNREVASDVAVSCPDGLMDTQKSGFIL